jgi:hypothetical protein
MAKLKVSKLSHNLPDEQHSEIPMIFKPQISVPIGATEWFLPSDKAKWLLEVLVL